jgi:opacity protein-like surface antigen
MRQFLAASLLLLAAGSPAFAQNKPNAAQFGWLTDYAAARAEAKRTGKPLFLVFRCEP